MSTSLTGQVMGGQQPVSGSMLQLYAVSTVADGGASTALLTGSVSSNSLGQFSITNLYTCPSASTLVYITATGGNPGLSSGTNANLSLMTALGGLGHTVPYLIPDFWTATAVAVIVVAIELGIISWIRNHYMDTPLLGAIFQVVVGGVLVFLAGILIGSS